MPKKPLTPAEADYQTARRNANAAYRAILAAQAARVMAAPAEWETRTFALAEAYRRFVIARDAANAAYAIFIANLANPQPPKE